MNGQGGLCASAVMRRIWRLVNGCCYCGRDGHTSANCPWHKAS